MRIEQPLPPEPTDHAAADPFGERCEVALGERPSWQLVSAGGFAFAPPAERSRRPAGAVRARQEDAVGDGRVQMSVAVEAGAEAVEKGDGAEPWMRAFISAMSSKTARSQGESTPGPGDCD